MAVLKSILKTAGETAKIVGKTVKTAGKEAYKVAKATGIGEVIEDAATGIPEAVGDAATNASKKVYSGAKKATKKVGPAFIRDATEEELKESGLVGGLVKKRLTAPGMIGLTAVTMGASTVDSVKKDGGTKFNRLGEITRADNLDRLISYDGSGFLDNVNQVSQGDPEIMQDIVSQSFDNLNQYGASGDLVFALHNMREG